MQAIVIAGANGAGKTTLARELIPLLYPRAPFLNADEIQREAPQFAALTTAGRELLQRLDTTVQQRQTFVLETTLSSALYARRIRQWRANGYRVVLHFIELPSADYAVVRVARRVAAGGHSVPEADIRRRFHRGLVLFEQCYKPLADEWYHWLSDDNGLQLHRYEPS